MKRRALPSKSRLLTTTALGFGIPMCVFTCAMLWKMGGLTVSSAFGVVLLCALGSFGFAAAFVHTIEKKYGPFKD
jgi:hypothetical protein